ncbi:MAG: MBL fold metallo-hydrolase [Pseudomonadota bacterium]
MVRVWAGALAAAGMLAGCAPAGTGKVPKAPAAPAAPAGVTFTTLGTNSGPISNPARAEAASLVRAGDTAILVDAGDGAVEQLAKAGLSIGDLNAVFLSHLHFDHTGGLFALVSLRFQAGYAQPLVIYGPPGTKATVEGLLAAMGPGTGAVRTMRPKGAGEPDSGLTVVELGDGAVLTVGSVKVVTAANSHYETLPEDARPVSLSYRFEAPGRTMLFTGDTGPSEAVAALCRGADGKGVDLLVSEIMDPKLAIKHIRARRPDIPVFALPVVESHFRKEHLSPDQVGRLGSACGAKALVLTHIALLDDELAGAMTAIGKRYSGPVTFARDLGVY